MSSIIEAISMTRKKYFSALMDGTNQDRYMIMDWIAWAYKQNGHIAPTVMFARNPTEAPRITIDERLRGIDTKEHFDRTIEKLGLNPSKETYGRLISHSGFYECFLLSEALAHIIHTNSKYNDPEIDQKYITNEMRYPHYGIKDLPVIIAIEALIASGMKPERNADWWERYKQYAAINAYGIALGKRYAVVCMKPDYYEVLPGTSLLHSVKGPAVLWRDGTKSWYLFGKMFEEHDWDTGVNDWPRIEDLFNSFNTDDVSCVMRALGPEWFLDQAEKVVKVSETIRGNTLFKAMTPWIASPIFIVRYRCPSTGKTHYAFIPDGNSDADNAVAWRHRLTNKQYMRLIES